MALNNRVMKVCVIFNLWVALIRATPMFDIEFKVVFNKIQK